MHAGSGSGYNISIIMWHGFTDTTVDGEIDHMVLSLQGRPYAAGSYRNPSVNK
jgi:hypothetical protein